MKVKIISMGKLKKIASLDADGDYQPNFDSIYFFPKSLFNILGKTYKVIKIIKRANSYYGVLDEDGYAISINEDREIKIPEWYVEENMGFDLE